MLVDTQDPSAAFHWPRGIVEMREVAWIGVDQFDCTRPARLRRSLLMQDRRQGDKGRHLQKFALPILEERFPWMSHAQIRQQGDCRGPMANLLLVEFVPTSDDLAGQKDHEQAEHDQRQRSIPHPPDDWSPRGRRDC
jgi:hypothetical protein